MVIKPYTPKDEQPAALGGSGVCNAYATTRPNSTTTSGSLSPGASTDIHYDKARWCTGSRCAPKPGEAADGPGETLLHEMLHGLRIMAGQGGNPLPIGLQYDNMEEFYAILITNIYMSERGRKRLRKNHHTDSPLDPDASTSEGFLLIKEHVQWLKWLVDRSAVLLRRVADINAPFNPIRAYLADPTKYIEMTKSQ
jgi:hypothetical protein